MTGGLCSQLEVNADIDTVGPLRVCGKGGTGKVEELLGREN